MRPPIVKKTNFKSFGTVKLHSRPVYKKGALQLAAAHDSGFDAVDGYSVNSARMSGAWSKADSLCSKRVIPSLTQMYGPAARCKRLWSTLADRVLRQCIRSPIGACAPGHHGYQRACDLITG